MAKVEKNYLYILLASIENELEVRGEIHESKNEKGESLR
jgi:hypothetical protein